MKTVAIIQARLNSSRLHHKMLLPLLGKPMLFHVIERVKRAKLLDDVVVTVPINDFMSFKAVFDETGVKAHLRAPGEDNDLVKAYYEAAKAYDANVVVRVCADNPCVEGKAIDILVEHGPTYQGMSSNAGDVVCSWPNGIGAELYTDHILHWLNRFSRKREHPHSQFLDKGIISVPRCPERYARPDIRLDVNTQADYDKINDIYNHFGNNTFHITEVIKYLDVLAKRRVD